MLMGSTKLSTWGLVLYQNFLSIPIMLALGLQTGDFKVHLVAIPTCDKHMRRFVQLQTASFTYHA